LKVLRTAACILKKRWAERADLNRRSLHSRRRTAWCEFSARLFLRSPCSCRQVSPNCRNAEAYERSLSVTSNFRREALLLEQLAHQPQCRPRVATALDQHVEHLALVIDSSPELHPLASDPNHHLIQMPAIARPWAMPATFGEQILHISVARRETQVQPDRVLDDRRRKSVAAIRLRGHRAMLSHEPLRRDPVPVTIPLQSPTPSCLALDAPDFPSRGGEPMQKCGYCSVIAWSPEDASAPETLT
jgi:hypothetical protein